jgi:4-hydroxy-3-methylbut-2-enyl diphosphate reductase
VSGLLIAAPLRLEALLIGSAVSTAQVRRTGMGRERSLAAARALLEDHAAALLVMGFCGGLSESAQPGDVIVCDGVLLNELIGRDEAQGPAMVCGGGDSLAAALESHGLRVRRGTIVSVSRPVRGSRRRAALHALGAIAVDTESAWLARGLYGRDPDGQPFGVVRVVVDTPTRELMRPLATLRGGIRASLVLRRVAHAVDELIREHGVHTVFGATPGGPDG